MSDTINKISHNQCSLSASDNSFSSIPNIFEDSSVILNGNESQNNIFFMSEILLPFQCSTDNKDKKYYTEKCSNEIFLKCSFPVLASPNNNEVEDNNLSGSGLYMNSCGIKELKESWFSLPAGRPPLVEVHLSDNEISSLFTKQLNFFKINKYLKVLHLQKNYITSLSAEIKNCEFLEELYLDNNCLKELPDEISELKHLKSLFLSKNVLWSLPKDIGNLTNLSILKIENNLINELPFSIGNCYRLEVLHMQRNNLTELPFSLKNLYSLKSFSLEWLCYLFPFFSSYAVKEEEELQVFLTIFRAIAECAEKKNENLVSDSCRPTRTYLSLIDFLDCFPKYLRNYQKKVNPSAHQQEPFDINLTDSKGRTRLHLGCMNQHISIVSSMIGAGFNCDTLDKQKRSPLFLAVQAKNFLTAEMLLQNKVAINSGAGRCGSPLHMAVINFDFNMCKLLIEYGANVNVTDNRGNTPLHILMSNFRKGCFSKIYNFRKLFKYFQRRKFVKHINNVKSTLNNNNNNPDLNFRDDIDHFLIVENVACEIADLLINNGANCNALNNKKLSPMHLACSKNQLEAIQYIVKNYNLASYICKRALCLHSDSVFTSLFSTIFLDNLIMDPLIYNQIFKTSYNSYSAENATTHDSFVPCSHYSKSSSFSRSSPSLQLIASSPPDQQIGFFLPEQDCFFSDEKKCFSTFDINFQCGTSFFTPLQLAAKLGYIDIVLLLIESGVNIFIRNKLGFTCSYTSREHLVISKLLMNAENEWLWWRATDAIKYFSEQKNEFAKSQSTSKIPGKISNFAGKTSIFVEPTTMTNKFSNTLLRPQGDQDHKFFSLLDNENEVYSHEEINCKCSSNDDYFDDNSEEEFFESYIDLNEHESNYFDNNKVVNIQQKSKEIIQESQDFISNELNNELLCYLNDAKSSSTNSLNSLNKYKTTHCSHPVILFLSNHIVDIKKLFKPETNKVLLLNTIIFATLNKDEDVLRQIFYKLGKEIKNFHTIQTVEGKTLLHLATIPKPITKKNPGQSDCADILLFLLNISNDWNLECRDNIGMTPLHFACIYDELEAVKLLLAYGADPNAKEFTLGLTPLHLATMSSHYSIMLQLLYHPNIQVNKCDIFNWSPTLDAAYKLDAIALSLLINRGALVFSSLEIFERSCLNLYSVIDMSKEDKEKKIWLKALLNSNGLRISKKYSTTQEKFDPIGYSVKTCATANERNKYEMYFQDDNAVKEYSMTKKKKEMSEGISSLFPHLCSKLYLSNNCEYKFFPAVLNFSVPAYLQQYCNLCGIQFKSSAKKKSCRCCGFFYCTKCCFSRMISIQFLDELQKLEQEIVENFNYSDDFSANVSLNSSFTDTHIIKSSPVSHSSSDDLSNTEKESLNNCKKNMNKESLKKKNYNELGVNKEINDYIKSTQKCCEKEKHMQEVDGYKKDNAEFYIKIFEELYKRKIEINKQDTDSVQILLNDFLLSISAYPSLALKIQKSLQRIKFYNELKTCNLEFAASPLGLSAPSTCSYISSCSTFFSSSATSSSPSLFCSSFTEIRFALLEMLFETIKNARFNVIPQKQNFWDAGKQNNKKCEYSSYSKISTDYRKSGILVCMTNNENKICKKFDDVSKALELPNFKNIYACQTNRKKSLSSFSYSHSYILCNNCSNFYDSIPEYF